MSSSINRRQLLAKAGSIAVASAAPALAIANPARALSKLAHVSPATGLIRIDGLGRIIGGAGGAVLGKLVVDTLKAYGKWPGHGPRPPHPMAADHHRRTADHLRVQGFERIAHIYAGTYEARDDVPHMHFGPTFQLSEADDSRDRYQAFATTAHHRQLCSLHFQAADIMAQYLLTMALSSQCSPRTLMMMVQPIHVEVAPEYDDTFYNHHSRGAVYQAPCGGYVAWRNRGFGGPDPRVQCQVLDQSRQPIHRLAFHTEGPGNWKFRRV
jgi:hypothetical protein